jgi:hypothetical protein
MEQSATVDVPETLPLPAEVTMPEPVVNKPLGNGTIESVTETDGHTLVVMS